MEKRIYRIDVRMTESERSRIMANMRLCGFSCVSTYMRRIAIRGRIVRLELPELEEILRLVRICSNNLNQYAKRANETGSIYTEDISDLQRRLEEIWEILRQLMKKLSEIT